MAMKSFTDAVKSGRKGLVIRNSVFLPFHCELLSIWVGKEMSLISAPDLISDLTDCGQVALRVGESYTNIVLKKWGDLAKELGHHKGHIILHAAEKGADIFLPENLHYIRIGFVDHGKEVSLEIIDNPFEL
jgi:hypothetical protein